MTKKTIKLEPSEEITETTETPMEKEPPIQEPELLIPSWLRNKESEHIIDEITALLNIYYNANQIGETPIPKNGNWYINELLLILKKYNIVG